MHATISDWSRFIHQDGTLKQLHEHNKHLEQRFQFNEAAKVIFKSKSVPFSFSACFLAI